MKRYWEIILLLSFAFLITACANQNQPKELEAQTVSDCIEKNSLWCYTASFGGQGSGETCADTKDGCLAMRVRDTKDGAICQTIGLENEKAECYKNVAEVTSDESKCNLINSQEIKSQCIGRIAASKGNSDVCSTATSSDDCYLEFVMISSPEKKDSKVCDKIKDAGKKETCSFFANTA